MKISRFFKLVIFQIIILLLGLIIIAVYAYFIKSPDTQTNMLFISISGLHILVFILLAFLNFFYLLKSCITFENIAEKRKMQLEEIESISKNKALDRQLQPRDIISFIEKVTSLTSEKKVEEVTKKTLTENGKSEITETTTTTITSSNTSFDCEIKELLKQINEITKNINN